MQRFKAGVLRSSEENLVLNPDKQLCFLAHYQKQLPKEELVYTPVFSFQHVYICRAEHVGDVYLFPSLHIYVYTHFLGIDFSFRHQNYREVT